MSPDFKLENRDLDTVSLEKEIEKRVAERKAAGVYTHEVESLLAERLPGEDGAGGLSPLAALDYSSTRAMSSWEVSTAYPVETEKKKLIAPVIIFIKRIARLWARIAVGPIQREQTAFNRHAASALDAVRKETIARRAQEHAEEEDLAELAGVLVSGEQSSWIADAVAEEVKAGAKLTILSPCPGGLAGLLGDKGYKIYKISPGSTWEESNSERDRTGRRQDAEDCPATISGPAAFLCRAAEESIGALLVSELAFLNEPGRIVTLLRQSYLALEKGGTIVVAVCGLAAGAASPWCTAAVIEKALAMAGFKDIRIKSGPGGRETYVAFAGK